MQSLADYYLWIKALHIISVISWMAGLFYLPRLFAYHALSEKGSVQSETFKTMERRLLKIIINPAMIASFFFGILLLITPGIIDWSAAGWMHLKLVLVFGMAGFHGFLVKCFKTFEADQNTRTDKFYRVLNEVAPVLMIAIVILAVVKPF